MRRIENYNFVRQPSFSMYELLKDEARRFCSETGLHGFQYISMKGNTPTERFAWTVISFGALILALTLSTLSWIYSANYPTMIVTDSMQHPISTFLYPGISICNLNKISKRKAYAFVRDKLKVDNATYWQDRMHVLAQMYFANYDTTNSNVYHQLQHILDKNNITAEDALVQVTPSCKEFLDTCSWKAIKARCDSMFQAQRTPEGMCCTFNHFALRNRVFSGYNAKRYKAYPKKLASCGQQSALRVLVHINPKDYLVSEISAHGAKVLIHDTYNYPDWSAQRVLVPMMQLMYVDINPYRTYATDAVRAMSVESRGCVFTDERKLALYSNYSYENCLAECRIGILEKLCNCMPFYLRNEWANWYRPLRVCNLRDIACISAHKRLFGGLLGLCLGFTFTAIFDMFYTFTIRLGIAIYRKKKELARVHDAGVGKAELRCRLETNFNVLPVDHVQQPRQEPNNRFRQQTDIWYIN